MRRGMNPTTKIGRLFGTNWHLPEVPAETLFEEESSWLMIQLLFQVGGCRDKFNGFISGVILPDFQNESAGKRANRNIFKTIQGHGLFFKGRHFRSLRPIPALWTKVFVEKWGEMMALLNLMNRISGIWRLSTSLKFVPDSKFLIEG